MTYCADTFAGRVHRFPIEGEPCQCGAVIANRREIERPILVPEKPTGQKRADILDVLAKKPLLSCEDITAELHASKHAIKSALYLLARAKKIIIARRERRHIPGDLARLRSVALYSLPPAPAYPVDDARGV